MFKCDKCGLCCRHLPNSDLFKDMRLKSGICKYLGQDNLCTIYSQRPIFCRVDDAFDLIFKNNIRKDDYYKLNYEACRKLKEEL